MMTDSAEISMTRIMLIIRTRHGVGSKQMLGEILCGQHQQQQKCVLALK